MAVYDRPDSKFFWMALEREGRAPLRRSTRVLKDAATPGERRDRKRLAEQIYAASMGDIARGTFKLPTARPHITFTAHAEWYRDTISKHHRGGRREVSIVNALIRAFGEFHLDQIEESTIEDWKALRVTEVVKTSVNRELDVLKPLLEKAVPKYLEASPAANVRRFSVRRFPPITILKDFVSEDALLEHATPEDRALMLLGLDALMRAGDARTFNVAHDHGAHLEIVDPKTGVPYKVPTSARLREALDAIKATAMLRRGYYFARIRKGKCNPICEATAWSLFSKLCARAGVPSGRAVHGITFHGLRHTGTSRALRATKATAVMRLGGWSSLRQLVRYDHPDEPDLIRGIDAISARPQAANVHPIAAAGTDHSRVDHAGSARRTNRA